MQEAESKKNGFNYAENVAGKGLQASSDFFTTTGFKHSLIYGNLNKWFGTIFC
jgi:hypothetical protein